MIIRQLASLALTIALSATASAQNTTVTFESFESGLPSSWVSSGTGPAWRLFQNAECGAHTQMVGFGAGAPTCNYSTGGSPADSGLYSTSVENFLFSTDPAYLSFDYILDIDQTGDQVAVGLDSNFSGAVIFADTSKFLNDGLVHSVVLNLPQATLLGSSRLLFTAVRDGIGDQGRGWMIDNVRISRLWQGAGFCGSSPATCPCANGGGALRGCDNSFGNGASLRGVGSASVSADSLLLGVVDVPPGSPTQYFEGTAVASAPFGDGILCVGGSVVQIGIKFSAARLSAYPEPFDAAVSVLSPVLAGTTRYYQARYRDPNGPCGQSFNLTNGWKTTWGP